MEDQIPEVLYIYVETSKIVETYRQKRRLTHIMIVFFSETIIISVEIYSSKLN
jgi:hypothetical protein